MCVGRLAASVRTLRRDWGGITRDALWRGRSAGGRCKSGYRRLGKRSGGNFWRVPFGGGQNQLAGRTVSPTGVVLLAPFKRRLGLLPSQTSDMGPNERRWP